MKIKTSPKVLYKNNPLIEVLAQVRFARIEPLISSRPEKLERHLRERGFVRFEHEPMAAIQISFGPEGVKQDPGAHVPPIYHYISEDGVRKVSLCADFLAYSSSVYVDWDGFKSNVIESLKEFSTHHPLKVLRVGLRYKDLIEREALGLQGTPWSELLTPLVSGVFGATGFFEDDIVDETGVEQQASQVLLNFGDSKLLFQSALLRSTDSSGAQAVLIDSDFYRETESAPAGEVEKILDALHDNADAVFLRCIKGKLHDALGPTR